MKNRKQLRSNDARYSQVTDQAMGCRVEESLQKVFGKASNEAMGHELGSVSEGTVRNWRKGKEIVNGKALAELARRGADIHYILTGQRREDRKEPAARDPLSGLIDAPPRCPNGGLCKRLAMRDQLVREVMTDDFLLNMDEEAVKVALHAVAAYRASATKQEAMETFEQGPVVDAEPQTNSDGNIA